MTSSPWAKITKPDPVNLTEIMSEQVARDLHEKEEKKLHGFLQYENDTAAAAMESPIANEDLDTDEMIARMLQMQFDKEHDDMLKKVEDKFNSSSKITVSLKNYRREPKNFDFESDPEDEEIIDIVDRKDWDRFDSLQREIDSIPTCGYKKVNGKVVTKHDANLSGRKNACKLLSFPPEFNTGDGEGFDLKLSNKVYNSLRAHSKQEQVRRHRLRDKREDNATAEFGMDSFTRLIMFKMIHNQLLQQINGVISIGKEAVILHAESDPNFPDGPPPPKECVLKVFKTTLSEFKQRDKYIKDDHRFKDKVGKQTARKTVHIWAEKEMANLMRLKKAEVPSPSVVTLKKHVLVMSFIGEDNSAAPKLKDAILSHADYIIAFDQVVDAMKKMYNVANLIHADLSEYNILWYKDQCYILDVSQSVEPSHEFAFHFLFRDCTNIVRFFTKKAVPELPSVEELFTLITGCDYHDTIAMESLQEAVKMKPHLMDRDDDIINCNFDLAWDKTQLEKKEGDLKAAVLVEEPKA